MKRCELFYLFTPMPNQRTTPDADAAAKTAGMPNRIREWRLARGMTLDQLSELVDLSTPMIAFLERGKRDLRYQQQVRIAEALGVSPAELLNDSDHDVVLTQDERQLLDDYRSLDAPNRRAVRGVAENLATFRAEPAASGDQGTASATRRSA